MTRFIAVAAAALIMVGATVAAAQDATGPGTIEVTIMPGGGTFFTRSGSSPAFDRFMFGGAATYHVNRIVGVEGEVATTMGLLQDLGFGGGVVNRNSPSTVTYSANLVIDDPRYRRWTPYATVGIGGLTMFRRASLGINDTGAYLTGNFGGGLKWYVADHRWGVGGDYRLSSLRTGSDAPAFVGTQTRYAHRIYAGVTFNPRR